MRTRNIIGMGTGTTLYGSSLTVCHLALNWGFEGLLDPATGFRGLYIFLHIAWMLAFAFLVEVHAGRGGLRNDLANYIYDMINGDDR
jgi:hypothetical protein